MQTIGKYAVVAEIARGGSGVVYRARDPQIQRDVAIKVLHASGAGDQARKRFQREASALGQLRHPGIVPLYDMGEQNGLSYLVLPLIEGESLGDRLEREGALPECEAVELVQAIAIALQHAHDHALLHRDVKPDNVLLDKSSQPLLTDFGLVKDLDASLSNTRLTVEGRFMGTPGFWSPEQARGELARFGPWTDVYGLGATLFALLTGTPPHQGGNVVDFLEAAKREVEPPSSRRADLNPQLDAICARCMALEPGARYTSARELADDLGCFLAGEQVAAPRLAKLLRAPSRLSVLALVAIAISLVVGLGAWWVVRSATRQRVERVELLLGEAVGSTAEEVQATRVRLAEVKTLVGDDPTWRERIEAQEVQASLWERLFAVQTVADLKERSALLRGVRRAAGPTVTPDLATALDEQVVVALRRVLALHGRPILALPDLARSRKLLGVVEVLVAAIAGPPPSDATRLARRALVLTRTEVLVARSRTLEPFDPLLDELTQVLATVPPDRVSLAGQVRLELGLMHARGGRFRQALRVLAPLFNAPGPDARVARAEAVTLVAMCNDQSVNVGGVIERVLAASVEDPWRHVVLQRKAIRTRDTELKRDAERALVERYPAFWFSVLTQGDLALARRDGKALRAAYDRAELLSPRDARVWWWKAATFGMALRYAGLGVMSKQQVAELRASREKHLRRLKEVLPVGSSIPEPVWSNVR